jgi:hypothetical protein
MSTSPAREFHGRDAELALIRAELERLSDGAEAVVLVEGTAGMGKSRLLEEVAAIARGLGIRVGRSAADPSETVVELATLLAALFDGTEPLLDFGELTTLHAQREQRFWLLRDLQQLLERAALDQPLLISIDDAHWADSGTVAALRTLPMRLMGLPIAWAIALRPPREATPLVHALEQLKHEGARSIALGPLTADAVVQLAADMLAAQPEQSILQQLAQADGSPFLVVETLLGLQEEERIRVVDGRAELIDGQLPRRVHQKMRERLSRLSDEASDAVTVAASLGRTFTFDELARTLGRPASDLLAPVGELLEANLLVERDENLAFWHDITREAVRASSSKVNVRPSEAATVTASLASSESRPSRSRIFSCTRRGSRPSISSARPSTTRTRPSSCSPRSVSTTRNGLPSASANCFRIDWSGCAASMSAANCTTASSLSGPRAIERAPSCLSCSSACTSGVASRGGRSATAQAIGSPISRIGRVRSAAIVPLSAQWESSIEIRSGDSSAARSSSCCRSRSSQNRCSGCA